MIQLSLFVTPINCKLSLFPVTFPHLITITPNDDCKRVVSPV